MQTQLKDVIHLYLGCQYRVRYIDYEVGQYTVWSVLTAARLSKLDDLSIADIQIQLRPLSSMTEEELDEVLKIGEHQNNGQSVSGFVRGWKAFGAQTFAYLLKQGFDIFNLIESGQAINAMQTTM